MVEGTKTADVTDNFVLILAILSILLPFSLNVRIWRL